MSSIARETNFYHSKVVLHHYPGKGSGFLWNMFGQKPHALDGLNLLPATTALATFSDLDAPMLWSVIQKQVAQSGFPQAEELLNKLPEKLRAGHRPQVGPRPRLARRRVRLRRHARRHQGDPHSHARGEATRSKSPSPPC